MAAYLLDANHLSPLVMTLTARLPSVQLRGALNCAAVAAN
jgi:hypothetical protein